MNVVINVNLKMASTSAKKHLDEKTFRDCGSKLVDV